MKNIMTMTVAAACIFALSACGGGGSNSASASSQSQSTGGSNSGSNDSSSASALSRADEGIWNSSSINSGTGLYGMQTVILNDGSYWGLYGTLQNAAFSPAGVLHGTASVDSGSVSGAYTDFSSVGVGGLFSGAYSGTVSAQSSLDLTLNDPSDTFMGAATSGGSFSMSYDGIYNQPASLPVIAGNYQGIDCDINPGGTTSEVCGISNGPAGTSAVPVSLAISGSSLTVTGPTGMNGTIAPHGTTVNVFDVNLTTTTDNIVPAGTVYKGILFQTSSGSTEIIAAAGSSAYFYISKKSG